MIFDIETIEDSPILVTIRNFARLLNDILDEKELKFKKLYPDVIAPQKAHNSDMCFDIFAYSDPIVTDTYIEYKTGLVFEIPEKYDMLLYARSSISNYDLVLANSVGVVDCIPIDANISISDTGEECLLKDILEGKISEVLSYNFEKNSLEMQKVEDVYSVGIKEVFLIELEDGRKIEVTENELIHTTRGWVKCKDLTLNDEITTM